MTLQLTGPISLDDIKVEFSGVRPVDFSKYYKGLSGGYVPAGTQASIPTSGSISLFAFYGAQASIFGTLTPQVSSVNNANVAEGQTVTFTLSGGSNITNGTYAWKIFGTGLDTTDISGGALTGTFTITSNAGSFTRTFNNDYTPETGETIYASIYQTTDTSYTTPLSTSATINVNDGTTYSIYSISTTDLYRLGGTTYQNVNITVDANYVIASGNTNLFYDIVPVSGSVTTDDIGALSGPFLVTYQSGSLARGVLTKTASTKYTGKSAASFQVRIHTGSELGPVVLTSTTINLRPHGTVSSVSRSPSATTQPEGTTITYTVNTSNIPNGVQLYYNTVGVTGTINQNDFTTTLNSTTGSISSNQCTFNIGINPNDSATDANESFRVDVYAPDNTTLLNTGQTITTIEPSATVTLGSGISYTMNETNDNSRTFYIASTVPNYTLYWYIIHNSTSAADFQSAVSGTVSTDTNGAASFTVTVSADAFTEVTQQFYTAVRLLNSTGLQIGNSLDVNISDTSQTPPPLTVSGLQLAVNNPVPGPGTVDFTYQVTLNRANDSGSIQTYTITINNTDTPDYFGASSINVSVGIGATNGFAYSSYARVQLQPAHQVTSSLTYGTVNSSQITWTASYV